MKRARSLAAAVWLFPTAALANGGVVGQVKLAGKPPALAARPVTKDATVCGSQKPSESVITGPAGLLRNVVVSLRGLKPAAAPAPTAGAAVDQVGCRYEPHVQAVTVGTQLTLVNSDRVLHNVHGSIGPVQAFNLAMPIKGQHLPTRLTRPGLVRLQCDAGHTWMSAYVYVFDHPYFAVTGADGHFEIKDVPPGHYTVEYWHESADGTGPGVTTTAEVTIKDGAPARADAVLVGL
jgi:plastocyanin